MTCQIWYHWKALLDLQKRYILLFFIIIWGALFEIFLSLNFLTIFLLSTISYNPIKNSVITSSIILESYHLQFYNCIIHNSIICPMYNPKIPTLILLYLYVLDKIMFWSINQTWVHFPLKFICFNKKLKLSLKILNPLFPLKSFNEW